MKNPETSLKALITTGLLACGTFCTQTYATTFVASAGALGGNDSVNWSSAGANFAILPSGFSVLSANGLTMTVSTSNATSMQRLTQGSGWVGNFSPGDAVLWNQGLGGTIIIDFSAGIFGFGGGAQAQSNQYGPFSGTISAFDGLNALLGSHAFNGNSTSGGNGSAVFAGIFDASGSIHRLVFDVTSNSGDHDFAINSLLLKTNGRIGGVPDAAASLPLLALALAGLAFFRRKLGSF